MGRISIALFGPLLVTRDTRSVTGFEYDKVRALLAFLALEADRPHRRETVAGLLWPEQPEKVARDSLRNALATLRKAIGDNEADPPHLFITREAIQFNTGSNHVLDTADFTQSLEHAAHHRHRAPDTCRTCAAWRHKAVELYRGPLLTQFSLPDSPEFETWLVTRREAFHHEAMDALMHLAMFDLKRGDYHSARLFAGRQLALEPWREVAHRQAMLALAFMGNRSGALKQYEACRETLEQELGVQPEPETVLLYERIRDHGLAAESVPRIIPAPIAPLIGREHDLALLYRKLTDPDVRLLTIVGPGGVGKTSLALAAGNQFGADFADGSVFVSLTTTERSTGIFPTIAAALGLIPEPAPSIERQVAEYLRSRDLLLVLDNFEHLLDGAILLVDLMAAAPGLVLLVTSRQRLGLTVEWLYELDGLAYPAEDSGDPLAGFSAVQLFARRAQQERGDFALVSSEAVAAAEICRLVQGMPLAIELAAAATAVRPANQIAWQLRSGLDALSAEWADLPPRHRSIRAAFEHSWIMLTDDERRILRRLSIFNGGFDVEAASAVAGATPADLHRLRHKSLLQVPENGRFNLHPLIRAYAAERLSARDETDEARRRHLAYFMEIAEQGEQALKGREQLHWLNRLEADHANIRAALSWAEESDYAAAVRLAAAMWLFWFMRGHLLTSRHLYEKLYAARDKLPLYLRARLLNGYTSTIMGQSDFTRIEIVAQEALACFRKLEDDEGIALSYHHLAIAARSQGTVEESITYANQGIAAAQQTANIKASWVLAVAKDTLSSTLRQMGRLEEAGALIHEGAAIALQLGDRWGWSYKLIKLGLIAMDSGDFDTAREKLEQTLLVAEEFGDRRLIAYTTQLLGKISFRDGDLVEAWRQIETAERRYRDLGDKLGQAEALELLGDMLEQRGFPVEAALRYREARDIYSAAMAMQAAQMAGKKLAEIEDLSGL